jgi:protocatechuate 3,4-dioxygenase beta subunit
MNQHHDDDHDDFGGFARDLRTMSRRGMFGMMAKAAAGLAIAPLVGACTSDGSLSPDAGSDGSATDASGSGTGTCSTIPTETAGPYPGDGTNGPNALALSGIERSDIRTSVGTATGTAAGVDLQVTLTLVNAATCAPLVGYAVYIWHCNQTGNYSMYTGDAQSENYLRGVQVSDATGKVTFTTIFPACYSGRWPHIHFEIYASLAQATSGNAKQAVSQLALPKATCDAVYATTGYEASVSNLSKISLATDMVFSDGSALQVPTITGAIGASLGCSLTVAIAA